MIKKVHLDDNHSVDLNGSMGWLFVYKAQFGRDILPELMPMLEALIEFGVAAFDGVDKDFTIEDLINNIDDATLGNAFATISSMELLTLIDIVWAMAKNADRNIEPPEEWINQFDVFPLETVIPEVLKIIIESSTTSKNSHRLLKVLKKAKLPSMKLSLESQLEE